MGAVPKCTVFKSVKATLASWRLNRRRLRPALLRPAQMRFGVSKNLRNQRKLLKYGRLEPWSSFEKTSEVFHVCKPTCTNIDTYEYKVGVPRLLIIKGSGII